MAGNRTRHGALLAAAVALGMVVVGTPASAAVDITPPTWSKVPTASIPVGAVLNAWDCNGDAEQALTPVYVDYRAADPQSGIDHYLVTTNQAMGPDDVGLATRVSTTGRTTDPADCGGGGRPIVSVIAVNGADLYSAEYFWNSSTLSVTQETPSPTVAYSGSWAVSTSTAFSGGTTRKTVQRGAAVTLSVTVPATDARPRTSAFGLVMAKAPDRGSAEVWVDGRKVATVSTYAATKVNRSVVWRTNLAPGTHTVRVVNLATAGRPRIDLDAAVLLPKGSRTFG